MHRLFQEHRIGRESEPQSQPRDNRLIGNHGLRVGPLIGLPGLPMQGLREIERRLIWEVEYSAPAFDDQHARAFLAYLYRLHAHNLKILFAPLSHCTVISPPFGVVGRPVAVSIFAIRSFVASVAGVSS